MKGARTVRVEVMSPKALGILCVGLIGGPGCAGGTKRGLGTPWFGADRMAAAVRGEPGTRGRDRHPRGTPLRKTVLTQRTLLRPNTPAIAVSKNSNGFLKFFSASSGHFGTAIRGAR